MSQDQGVAQGISLGRVTVLLLMSRAAGFVLALGNSVILARTLGVARLGGYAYATGMAALFGVLPNLGISTVVTRGVARNPDAGKSLLLAAVRAQTMPAAGVLVLIPACAAVLPRQPVPAGYLWLAAAQLAVATLSWPYLAVIGGRARYDLLALAEWIAGIAGTLCLIGAAALDGDVSAFLWGHLVAAGLAVLGARWIASPLLRATGEGPRVPVSSLLRQAAPFAAAAAVQSAYTRLDVLLLGQMAPASALGLYNVAYKPTNLAVYFGATVAGTLFPLMANTGRRDIPAAFGRAVRGLGAAGPAMALTLSGLADPVLRLLYGQEFSEAAFILAVLAWSAAANWLYAPLGIALQARGDERKWLASLVVALAVNAGGNLWAIPRWGATGAAGATLLSEVTLVILGAVLVGRVSGCWPPLRSILVTLGAAACGGGVLWLLSPVGPVPATLAALAAYGVILGVCRTITGADLRLLTGWVRQAIGSGGRQG